MSQKVRVGVIGTSWWSDMMHFPALQSHPQAEMVVICGRNQHRAQEVAAKYGGTKTIRDYRKMIMEHNLDAVIISTPDNLHYEMALFAVDAGLHVLCEKPLAMNAQQAWEMFQKAADKGVKHMTYFTYRWMPFYRYLRDLIVQGAIGTCYHCDFWFPMGHGRSKEYRWRFDKKRANGILGDLGSHMIDMARWLVGDITLVSAQLGVAVERSGADGEDIDPANDSASLVVRFANDAHGAIRTSAVTHLADRGGLQQIKLYGKTGSLETDLVYRGSETRALIRYASSQDEHFQTLEVPESYWGDADPSDPLSIFTKNPVGTRQFIEAILEDHPVEPNFYDGFKAQQVVDAALMSHEEGRTVSIDNSV
jgi:predicted dehydrogenase